MSEPGGPSGVLVKFQLTFERGELTMIVSVADGGWLTGIQLAPAEPREPPPYTDLGKFGEQDVMVGSGRWRCRAR